MNPAKRIAPPTSGVRSGLDSRCDAAFWYQSAWPLLRITSEGTSSRKFSRWLESKYRGDEILTSHVENGVCRGLPLY